MDDDNGALPPMLDGLRRLVTVLTLVMIVGFVVMITALVIRLNADPLPLPEVIDLPDGVSAVAFTQSDDWFAVVTDDDRILIYNRASGALSQTVVIE